VVVSLDMLMVVLLAGTLGDGVVLLVRTGGPSPASRPCPPPVGATVEASVEFAEELLGRRGGGRGTASAGALALRCRAQRKLRESVRRPMPCAPAGPLRPPSRPIGRLRAPPFRRGFRAIIVIDDAVGGESLADVRPQGAPTPADAGAGNGDAGDDAGASAPSAAEAQSVLARDGDHGHSCRRVCQGASPSPCASRWARCAVSGTRISRRLRAGASKFIVKSIG
jgi:hypothetical protein